MMHNAKLQATLCKTADNRPLATVDGMPGDLWDATPAQLRALAEGLLRIAADAEKQPTDRRGRSLRVRREYELNVNAA